MSASLTPKTPIRAKTSTLVNRAAPSVPPASQTYEPLVKSVLAYRLSRLFLTSGAICWAAQAAWSVWQRGTPFSFWTLVASLLVWAAASVPFAVLRKLFLTAQSTLEKSPQAAVSAILAKASAKTTLVTYIVSAIFVTVIHTQSGEGLGLFVKSKKHPYYLNGRYLFLLLSQAAVATLYLLRNALRDRFAFRWSTQTNSTLSTLFVPAAAATLALVLASAIFGSIRVGVLPIVYRLPVVGPLLRPFAAHFIRGAYTFTLPFRNFSFLGRAWFLGFTTTFIWEWTDLLFDGLISEPVQVCSKPNPTLLISGITSNDQIMKYFAYSELNEVVQGTTASAAADRQAIFGDQKNGPNLWGSFFRETIQLLENDYQQLLRRGAPAPVVASSAVAPVSSKKLLDGLEERIHATNTPLLRQSVLRQSTFGSPKELVLDQLSSDGPIAQLVDQTADAVHLPDLFKSVSAARATKSILKPQEEKVEGAVAVVTSGPSLAERARSTLVQHLRKVVDDSAPPAVKAALDSLDEWWTKERISRLVEASLPARELDVVAAEVLTCLVAASLEEDRYGVVQRDIPKVLETLLSFLTALETYKEEVDKKYAPPPLPQLDDQQEPDMQTILAHEKAAAELSDATGLIMTLHEGLQNGVIRIVMTFGDKLSAFKFSPSISQKLQTYMDYCR